MDAEIIAIGTELLLGATVDTNSAYLATQLATIGVPVRRVTLVRDDMAEIVGTLRDAMQRVKLIVCSGGLGPTGDDLTREAIAQATGRPLEFHQSLLDDIAARFAAFKRKMSESNRQQAYVPQDAYIIRNPRGTAPSFVAERDGVYIAALPGVPQELHYLTEHALLPYLRDEHGLSRVLVVREVHLSGITEAEAGERIADIMLGENPVVGITAKRGQYIIRIAATGASRDEAEALIAPLVEQISQRFQGLLLGDERLEQRVARLLAERGVRLALIEDTLAGPVYRALAQTPQGLAALAQVTLAAEGSLAADDYEQTARRLAQEAVRGAATIGLVVLTAPGQGAFKTVYLALSDGQPEHSVTFSRGVDFGLAQASEFVATAALELLRRWLERESAT